MLCKKLHAHRSHEDGKSVEQVSPASADHWQQLLAPSGRIRCMAISFMMLFLALCCPEALSLPCTIRGAGKLRCRAGREAEEVAGGEASGIYGVGTKRVSGRDSSGSGGIISKTCEVSYHPCWKVKRSNDPNENSIHTVVSEAASYSRHRRIISARSEIVVSPKTRTLLCVHRQYKSVFEIRARDRQTIKRGCRHRPSAIREMRGSAG